MQVLIFSGEAIRLSGEAKMKRFAVHEMDVASANLPLEGVIFFTKHHCHQLPSLDVLSAEAHSLGCCFQFSQLDPLFASPVQLACEWQKLGRLRMGSRNCRACTVSKRKRSKQRSGPGHPWRREGQSRHFKWSK